MAGLRIKRVNEQLKREISEILLGEVKDPRIGPVTVTGVSAAPDLTLARIFVRPLGSAEERRETLAGLDAAGSFIRSEVARRLRLRRVPELRFEVDESLEHAMRIERLLSELKPAEPAGEEATRPRDAEETGDGGGG
ncbi:MAG TPA: 30S ribosome-binding factor RbfA [Longimicrobiales bacterium]|nr:30S ribosome-binding factor RbfA [Longimicrobiales bacterium]